MKLIQIQQSGWTYDNGQTWWEDGGHRTLVPEENRDRILNRDKGRGRDGGWRDGWHVEPITSGTTHHVADWLPSGGGYARTRIRWESTDPGLFEVAS